MPKKTGSVISEGFVFSAAHARSKRPTLATPFMYVIQQMALGFLHDNSSVHDTTYILIQIQAKQIE